MNHNKPQLGHSSKVVRNALLWSPTAAGWVWILTLIATSCVALYIYFSVLQSTEWGQRTYLTEQLGGLNDKSTQTTYYGVYATARAQCILFLL